MTAYVLTGLCLAALALLLYAEANGWRSGRYAAKPLASLAFILVAVLGGSVDAGPYGTWILVGLILGAGGDVALMFEGPRWFLVGLVLFLAGHIAYVVAFADLAPVDTWAAPLALAPLLASAAVLVYLWPDLGSMRVPVIAYVAVITAMVAGAIAITRTFHASDTSLVILGGAVLFYASDFAVARQKFKETGFVDRAWGLPAYYGGQLLLAWSTLG